MLTIFSKSWIVHINIRQSKTENITRDKDYFIIIKHSIYQETTKNILKCMHLITKHKQIKTTETVVVLEKN